MTHCSSRPPRKLGAGPKTASEITNETGIRTGAVGSTLSELAASIGIEEDDRARQREQCPCRAASGTRRSAHAIAAAAEVRQRIGSSDITVT
jgi:hypothetical protein